jgi:hypothetical protein
MKRAYGLQKRLPVSAVLVIALGMIVICVPLTGCTSSTQAATVSSSTSSGATPSSSSNGSPGATTATDTANTAAPPGTASQAGTSTTAGTIPSAATTAVSSTASTGPVGPVATYGLKGEVVDFDSREPVAGVQVTVGSAQAVTSADGSFTIAGGVAKSTEILASKEGYFSARSLVTGEAQEGFWTCRIELVSEDSPNAPPPPPAE